MNRENNLTIAVHNLGCKVNSFETEVIRQQLENEGCTIVDFDQRADVYLINTCSVTNIADRKSRQMLHRCRKLNPEAYVIAVGCFAQLHAEELLSSHQADAVVGINKKNMAASLISEIRKGVSKKLLLDPELKTGRNYESMSLQNKGDAIRSFVKIQDGCDRFCSYCIIPYARGRARSRSEAETLAEVQKLAEDGCREVVLTGIHISSYGIDRGQNDALLQLLAKIQEISGIERIRLGSLEPGIITEDFVKGLKPVTKLCRHFHLSLQSGCDRTLKNMNRSYSAEEYYEKCLILREAYERPSLTTDIICGFPGETEENFYESLAFVKKVGFFETHIFPYSRRAGTRADKMPDQLCEAEKKRRAAMMIEAGKASHAAYLKQTVGKELEVLVEEKKIIEGRAFWYGHTDRYEEVLIDDPKDLTNRTVKCRALGLAPEGALTAGLIFE